METIAILADIHGNSPALRAVLEDIDHRGNVSKIYCTGDLIGIGPDTNEVLEMITKRSNFKTVSGNHDEAILALIEGKPYPKSHEKALKHHEWIAERLDPEFVPYLQSLPREMTTTFGQHKALIIHYQFQDQSLPISQDPFAPIVDPSFQTLNQLFKNRNESFITFGHHHPVHYFHTVDRWLINPGSLGCHVKSEARYALVHIIEEGLIVNLHAVTYEREAWLLQYEQKKVPDREFILKVFHGQK